MKNINIKSIENGWLLHWTEEKYDKHRDEVKLIPTEKAFTYDFGSEKKATWEYVVSFLTVHFQ